MTPAALPRALAAGLTSVTLLALAAPGEDVPRLDAELDVAAPVLTGASGEQTEPRAAWDGKQLLVTWRSSFWKDELRATRLSPTGEVLDGRGLPVAPRERNAGSAPVAAGTGGFLVAYVEDPARVRAVLGTAQPGLAFGPPATLFESAEDHAPSDPAVAFADPFFWVLWARQGPGSASIVATRVATVRGGSSLRVQDAVPVELGRGFGPVAAAVEGPPTGAAAGTWALWGVPGAPGMVELRLGRLDGTTGTGRPMGGAPLLTAPGVRVENVALAMGGGQRVAAAAIVRSDGSHDLRVLRFSPEGQPLDEWTAPPEAAARLRSGPSVAWEGQYFSVHWSVEEERNGRKSPALRAFAFPMNFAARAFPGPDVSRAGKLPILVPASPRPLLIWEEIVRWSAANDPADSDIRAHALPTLAPDPAATGQPPPPTTVSLATNWQSEPTIGWSGRRALVAFEDGREDKEGTDIQAARLELDERGSLRRLDGTGLPLGTGPASQRAPVVAWDGGQFVVAWMEGAAGLALTRVNEAGAVLDRPAQRVPGTEGHALLAEPALCQTGDGVLLVWAARRTAAATETELWALPLVQGQPAAAGSPFLLARTADTTFAPVLRLGCHRSAAVLVWSGLGRPDRPSALHLGRILPGARSFDPQPGTITLAEQVTEEWAGIASDGQQFLIAWRSFNERNQRTVFATRLDGQGRLMDERPVAVGQSNSGRRVTALWDGRQYLVMAVNTEGGNPFELRARRLSATPAGLRVLDPDWFRVATLSKPWGGGGPGAEGVTIAPGRTLLVYEQYPEDDASSNPRARARLLETPARLLAHEPPDAGATDGSPPAMDATADTGRAARAAGSGCQIAGHGSETATAMWLVALSLLTWLTKKRRPPSYL